MEQCVQLKTTSPEQTLALAAQFARLLQGGGNCVFARPYWRRENRFCERGGI